MTIMEDRGEELLVPDPGEAGPGFSLSCRTASAGFTALVAVLIAAFAGLATPPASGAGWLLPATSLPQGSADCAEAENVPRISSNPSGDTTIIWEARSLTFSECFSYIVSATRPAGSDTFQAPERVTPFSDREYYDPNVTVGPDGTTTAVFYDFIVPTSQVSAAVRTPGSDGFSTPVPISPIGDPTEFPEIASAPDGTTTATWIYANLQEGDDRYFVQSATRPAGADAFSPAINIGENPKNSIEDTPQIAVGPDGTAVVVWMSRDEEGLDVVQASTRPAGSATFGLPENVSKPANEASGPEVAIGPDGSATVVWSTSNPESGDKFQIQSATRPAGSTTFGQPVDLSDDGPWATEPEVAIGPDGTTTVVWNLGELPSASERIVQYSIRPAGSEVFGEARDVFPPAYRSAPRRMPNLDYRYPQVVMGPSGTTTVAWQRVVDGDSIVQAASKLAGADSFARPVNLSTSGRSSTEPQLAVGPCGGLLTATWDSSFQADPGANIESEVQTASQRIECKATLASPKVSGPQNVSRGKKVTFKVTVTNIGDDTATAVSLNAKGNGVKSRKEGLGRLTAGASRVVNLELSFSKRGNTEVAFTLDSKNAGKKAAKKTVKVK